MQSRSHDSVMDVLRMILRSGVQRLVFNTKTCMWGLGNTTHIWWAESILKQNDYASVTGVTMTATFFPGPPQLGLSVRIVARNMRDRQEIHIINGERINKILHSEIEISPENDHFEVGVRLFPTEL